MKKSLDNSRNPIVDQSYFPSLGSLDRILRSSSLPPSPYKKAFVFPPLREECMLAGTYNPKKSLSLFRVFRVCEISRPGGESQDENSMPAFHSPAFHPPAFSTPFHQESSMPTPTPPLFGGGGLGFFSGRQTAGVAPEQLGFTPSLGYLKTRRVCMVHSGFDGGFKVYGYGCWHVHCAN